MITLIASREKHNSKHVTTTLRDATGKVKAIFGSCISQPRKNSKQITINCNTYLIDWTNTVKL